MWSSSRSSFFYKNLVQLEAVDRKVTAYQYWFDDDFGNAITEPVTSTKSLSLISDISTGALSDGIHSFNIRFQDDSEMWSSAERRFFYKNFVQLAAVNRKVMAYRYWVDDSFDKVVLKTLTTPVKNLNLIADLDLTRVEKGEHILHLQYQDDDEMWSSITADTIEKKSLPIADFDYVLQENCDSTIASFTNNSIDGDTYLWNFGDGATSELESPTHVYNSAGSYTVVLTVTDTVTLQDSSVTKFVDVVTNTIVNIDRTVCDSFTSPSGNYVWSSSGIYTDTIPTSSGCDSILTINLTVNNSVSIDTTVIVLENELPYAFGTQAITEAGKYTEVFTAQNGCDSTVTLTLTLNTGDEIPPEVQCNSIDIFLRSDGRYALTEYDIAALASGSSDNVTDTMNLIISVFPLAFGCDDVGEITIDVYVTDEAGNKSERCWVNCNVLDTFKLTASAVENIEMEVAPGVCETPVEYPEISTTNACAKVEQTEGLGKDGLFPLGTIVEKWIITNTSGDTLDISFNVTISADNDSPTISALSDVSVDEDSDPVTIPLNGISFGSDCMEQGITVTAVSNNSVLLSNVSVNYTNGNSIGSLELTVSPEMSGVAKVTVTVADSEGAAVSESFNVTVNPVNDPPFVVSFIPTQKMKADSILYVRISSVLGDLFDDIDDMTLTITVTKEGEVTLPAWITFFADTLVLSPAVVDTGCVNITVTATDGAGEKADFTFAICVEANPTGINNVENGTFSVSMFPNPTKGEVTLRINSSVINDSEVIVRSITGSEIFKKKYKATGLIQLNLSDQVSGVYLISLKQDDKFIIEKLILDRK
jgi:PKD repeat protein